MVAKQAQRWRAGRCWGAEVITVPLSDLAEGDLERLMADPVQVVQVTARD